MTIKNKLYLIMAVTVVGILAIGASSLVGMNYVRNKLDVLTEHSTPYQLKTIELQRQVQGHTSSLMSLNSARDLADFFKAKGELDESLKHLNSLAQEVADFTGKNGLNGVEQLATITTKMLDITETRLKAEEAGRRADQLTKDKLTKISQELRSLDNSLRKSQSGSMTQLSSSNQSVKKITQKLRNVQNAGNSLSEVKQAVLEFAGADSKTAVIVATSKFDAASRKLTGSEMVKEDPVAAQALLEGMADVAQRVRGADGLMEQKKILLATPDEELRKKYSVAHGQVMQRMSQISVLMGDLVEKAGEDFQKEEGSFDASLQSSDGASRILAISTELVSEGAEISRLIREIFNVSKPSELTTNKNTMTAAFDRVAALQASASAMAKSNSTEVAAITRVTGMLREVRGMLLNKDGVADTLGNLLAAKQQAGELGESLREVVMAQRSEGLKGMSAAQQDQEKAIKSVHQVFKNNIAAVTGLGLAVLVIGILLSGLVLRSITKPITELSGMAERFGGGDFSGRLDESRKDEFGRLAVHFNVATAKLAEITGQLRETTAALNQGAQELTQASEVLASGATRQAKESNLAASAMTGMARSIDTVASNAQTAATKSGDAHKQASSGREVVARTVSGMEQIASSVREAATVIEALGMSSTRIVDVVSTISDIANQTNLLSLNAAIEAARAGSAGVGFAVVAEEVRKLAHESTSAALEIKDTIDQIRRDTESSVLAMRQGTERVSEGIILAHEASQSLDAIVESSRQSVAVSNQIAAAAGEQTQVAAQVSDGVEQIVSIAHDAEKAADDISQSAYRLNQLAGELEQMTGWFKV